MAQEGYVTDCESPKGRSPSALGDLARYSGYGVSWALTVAVLALGGLALDQRLGTAPMLALLGAVLGIAGGFWSLYARVARPQTREREAPAHRTGTAGRGDEHE